MTQIPSSRSSGTAGHVQQVAIRFGRWWYFIGLLVFVGITGRFIFQQYQAKQDQVAQAEMFQAVYYFEQGAFDKAIHGGEMHAGLLDIVKEYRFTRAANLACFYLGASYVHQRDYAKAVQYLARFRTKDLLLQARAWALMGDAKAEQTNYREASDYYMRAAAYKPNKVFTPVYLTKAALAYEADKNYQAALSCYRRIVQKFPEAVQYGEAVKHTARLAAIEKRRSKHTGAKLP